MREIIHTLQRQQKSEENPQTGKSIGLLSPEGFEHARQNGRFMPLRGRVGFYHSPQYTSFQTAALMAYEIALRSKENEQSILTLVRDLDVICWCERSWEKVLHNEEGSQRTDDEAVDFMLQRPHDKERWIPVKPDSPYYGMHTADETPYMAANRVIAHLTGTVEASYKQDFAQLISVTHSPVIDFALQRLMAFANMTPFESVKQIGGSFQPGEYINVHLRYQPHHGLDEVIVKYRNEEFSCPALKWTEGP